MSINSVSYSNMEMNSGGPKVVELDALKTVTPENVFCQSTAFEVSVAEEDQNIGRSQSALSERMSDKEELSGASLTSTSTESSSDLEEHRHLSQSFASAPLHDSYSSFCSMSTCSESELSCSTLEGDSSYNSSFTEDSSWDDTYSDDDRHYKLIQPPISEEDLEFWALPDSDEDGSHFSLVDELLESSLYKGCSQEDHVPGHDEEEEEHEKQEFCVQCHAWPEVEDCRGEQRARDNHVCS